MIIYLEQYGLKLILINSDIFDFLKLFNFNFDIVFEHTCYCVIDLGGWVVYVAIYNKIIKSYQKL